jgi:two-component system nitrate/nitrite response regulator NarL
MGRTSVLIADRQPVVLRGLKDMLEADDDFEIVACCRDGKDCIEAIRRRAPEIVILETSMPGISGLEILALTNAERLPTRLVFFTSSIEDSELVMFAAAGAFGVILKDAEPGTIVQSLREVANGQKVLPLPPNEPAFPDRNVVIAENALKVLTDRERQIIALVCEGLSNKEIGRRLNIASGTIKVHLHHIYQKLEISNRTVLAALAISQHEITGAPPDPKTS